MMINTIHQEIQKNANPQKAKILQRFFKTGKGEYGEGDIFVGLTVPQSRKLAVKYKNLSLNEIKKLLQSKIHEERLIALLILVHNFNIGDEKKQKSHSVKTSGDKEIYDFYLSNIKYINNWDLVDLSADRIVGEFLFNIRHSGDPPAGGDSRIKESKRFWAGQNDDILIKLARSQNIWERRIAIISTYAFIKNGEFKDTLNISEILLNDKHDLIHKAVGWMLREVGKRCSQEALEQFLKKHYKQMPRTTLRYSIERFPQQLRKTYLEGLS